MRMDQNQAITCATILNTYTEEKLADILEQYGEITNAKQVANDIVKTRRGKALSTISDLKMILQKQGYGKPEKYMACVFQALRIEVNGELDALKQLLIDGTSLLKKGGRMVVISYHSLEDRLVKQYFKNGCFNDEPEKDEFGKITHDIPLKPLGNNAIVPDEEELKLNTRSRSAKMRIGIKK
jgi:16S rRNA (cytosine1402-N4)-methyltransferase